MSDCGNSDDVQVNGTSPPAPLPPSSTSSPVKDVTNDEDTTSPQLPAIHVASNGNDENGVESGSDSSSEEDDEGLLEPRFKYERVDGADAKQLLSNQVATCIVAHEKFIAVGTQTGYVWIMDHMGNVDHQHVPVLRPHRSAVTRLAVDSAGNYVMSCANDGRVAITGLCTTVLNHVLTLQIMPRSIAISPSFSHSNATPMFVVGERNLVLYEKKFFSYKDTTLFRGGEQDGFISRCSWHKYFVAFTNDAGTRIYDRSLEKMITRVNPSHDVDRIRSSRFPPTHSWIADDSLAIAWADTVTVVVVVTVNEGVIPSKRCEIHYSWHLDGLFCSGVSTILPSYISVSSATSTPSSPGWSELVVFGLKPDAIDETDFCDTASMTSIDTAIMGNGPIPLIQVRVLEPVSLQEYLLLAEDALSLSARGSSQPCQYHMAGLPSCESYFLLGPSDLVVASPYCAIDAVKWRVSNNKWEDAWDLAREKAAELEGTDWDCQTVGRAMIEHLLDEKRPRLAAHKLKEVCGESRGEWEWAVGLFEARRLSTLLAEVLPTSHPQLEPECYESILHAALYNDVHMFKKLVQQWSPDLYRTGSLTGLTLRRIQDASTSSSVAASEGSSLDAQDETCLFHALAHLYVYERKFESAIKIYMSLRDQHIFAVIDKYQLFELVKEQISELMNINTARALRLLLDNEDSVPASVVMTKIARQPKLQMAYLTRLLNKNEGAEFADQAVRLYAEYDRSKLLPFLRKNENYHIIRALDICRNKTYVEEMILLLGKSGNHLDALDLMVKKYNRLDKAIDYCKEHDDQDLWNHLIDGVVRNPDHVAQLLNQAGSSVDPLAVIQKIPLEMSIPGLRDVLAKVLRDCAARVELLRGCRSATHADSRSLLSDFLWRHGRTVPVGMRTKCSVCNIRLSSADESRSSELRIFGCGHSAHMSCCLESERKMLLEPGACSACSEATRDETVV